MFDPLCHAVIEVTNPTKIVLIEVTNPTKIVLIDTSNANHQVHPQSLHLKLLFILLEKIPKNPTDTARSTTSSFLMLVDPQVGQWSVLAAASRCFSAFFFAINCKCASVAFLCHSSIDFREASQSKRGSLSIPTISI